jgi:hypothetical protein
MATLECKLAMCISRLMEFELLLELKIEQKNGTSLVKLVLSRIKSGLRTERLSVPVIYFDIRTGISRTLPNTLQFNKQPKIFHDTIQQRQPLSPST